jgi:hypothetical protein
MKLLKPLALAVALTLPVQVFSFGKQDAERVSAPVSAEEKPVALVAAESAVSGQIVEVSGRVRLVGNEPFPELVLTDTKEHTWYIAPDDRKILSPYEQQNVTIRGTVELQEMVLANGKSLGSRRTLSGITLVKVNGS